MIEETIKALNNEESEAVEVESELDDVAEKIKKLLLTSSSIPRVESSMRLTAGESEMVNEDNSCSQIFVAFTELEREEETKQKLILIRQITKANTDICSHGEGCKIFSKV